MIKRFRTATIAAGACLLTGCGVWLGDREVRLEGERIALRQAAASAPATGTLRPPAARPVTDWPQAGGAAHRSLGNISGSVALDRVWSVSIGAGSDSESRITAAPVAARGRVFALDAAAQVTAVSFEGDRVWRADIAPDGEDGRDGFGGGLAVLGDSVIASTGFGEVVALSAETGERQWTFQAEAPIRAAPAIARDRIVVVTRDGAVIGLSSTGEELWRVIGIEGGAGMMGGGGSAPAISGEVVAAPFASGDISIMRLRDGRRGWSEPVGGNVRGSAMSLIADVTSPPVLADGRIYAGGVSGRLVAFEIPTGRRVWSRDIGAYNPVWTAGAHLFVISEDARLMALHAPTGRTIWETALDRFDDPEDKTGVYAYGGPIMVDGKLVLVGGDRQIFSFDAASGALVTEEDMPGLSAIPPIAAGGYIFVIDEDGDLHAYQ